MNDGGAIGLGWVIHCSRRSRKSARKVRLGRIIHIRAIATNACFGIPVRRLPNGKQSPRFLRHGSPQRDQKIEQQERQETSDDGGGCKNAGMDGATSEACLDPQELELELSRRLKTPTRIFLESLQNGGIQAAIDPLGCAFGWCPRFADRVGSHDLRSTADRVEGTTSGQELE
jgi:hypothetical protein